MRPQQRNAPPQLAISILLLVVVGCTDAPRLSKSDVVDIANRAAAYVRKDGSWTLFFEQKPPARPGGHFQVWIDDATRKADVMPGE